MELGELQELFERRNPYKLVAYVWFVLGGCALLAFAMHPKLTRDGEIILGFTIAMAALGWFWLRTFPPLRLEIRERGFVYRGRPIAYADMKSITDRRFRNNRVLNVQTTGNPFELRGEVVGDQLLDKVRGAIRDHGGPTVN